jgi:hypothetical protein
MLPNSPSYPRWLTGLLLVLLALAISLPRLIDLEHPVTPDEDFWLNKSGNFYMGLSHGLLAWTHQVGHPGVTVMWAGMAGFLLRFPEYRQSELGQVESPSFNSYLDRIDPALPLELLTSGRFFMVIAHALILLTAYAYAWRLFGLLPAFFSFLLIAFDPFHVALTRLLHTDGLLANLTLLALLALISYLGSRRPIDIFISGFAGGLALLTKSPAILLLPVVGLLAAYHFWSLRGPSGILPQFQMLKQALFVFGLWVLIAVIVFVALWPAMWVTPVQTMTDIIFNGMEHIASEVDTPRFFNGESIPVNQFGPRYWYFYPLSYVWRSTPAVLLGLLMAMIAIFKVRPLFTSKAAYLTLVAVLLLICILMAAFTMGDKKFERYTLPIYPPLDMLAGLGWSSLALFLSKRSLPGLLRYLPHTAILGAFLLQASLAIAAHPYYLAYYNPLLGGSLKARQVWMLGWGEGLDLAAQYLNEKPGAENLKVYSFFEPGCFSYYFAGQSLESPNQAKIGRAAIERIYDADYLVIYISQFQGDFPELLIKRFSQRTPEHTIWINGLEYAKIYKLH